jgi:hypothetical protein
VSQLAAPTAGAPHRGRRSDVSPPVSIMTSFPPRDQHICSISDPLYNTYYSDMRRSPVGKSVPHIVPLTLVAGATGLTQPGGPTGAGNRRWPVALR